jgi:hypothetical protein
MFAAQEEDLDALGTARTPQNPATLAQDGTEEVLKIIDGKTVFQL